MTRDELIESLQQECRTDRTKVEDFLNAISDLCLEEIKNGKPFHVGNIGFLALNPRLSRKGNGLRAALIFQASKHFRKRIGVPDEETFIKHGPGTCKQCGLRPRKVRVFERCDSCVHARNRGRKSGS